MFVSIFLPTLNKVTGFHEYMVSIVNFFWEAEFWFELKFGNAGLKNPVRSLQRTFWGEEYAIFWGEFLVIAIFRQYYST
jgi:hypothetical protein